MTTDPHQVSLSRGEADVAIRMARPRKLSHLIAARAGAGVAGLPCFPGEADKALTRLEDPATSFQRDIWLTTHRELKRSKPVQAVMEYLGTAFLDDSMLGPASA